MQNLPLHDTNDSGQACFCPNRDACILSLWLFTVPFQELVLMAESNLRSGTMHVDNCVHP